MKDALHHVKSGKCNKKKSKSRRDAVDSTDSTWPELENDYEELIESIQQRKIRKNYAG